MGGAGVAAAVAADALRAAGPSHSHPHPFKGRTVAVVNDLAVEEQWYLYQKARELREAVAMGTDLSGFRLRSSEMAVYTIFMEDSTRTKESFRNAAMFHGMKVNVFDAQTSSFQKNETITDTVKMLCGYSIGQSIFVIRSKLEGVCTWLEEAIGEYTRTLGVPRASFINAGDGRHEHPSQEFLDEFSFLEQLDWDRSHIHLALLGDLFHGRTVHSKVEGLKLYASVEVDLVAPSELALPKMYEDRMVAAGFIVRKFASIAEYLEQPKVARLWYFTRLQLERMGDKVLEKSQQLRQAVTMSQAFVDKLPAKTKFFHPLPRDGRHPTLPFWLDKMELNGWDRQSQNGYFTRIVLLGMLGGLFGDDFVQGTPAGAPSSLSRQLESAEKQPLSSETLALAAGGSGEASVLHADFIQEVSPAAEVSVEDGGSGRGLVPLQRGIIIEGLAEGQSEEQIWALMHRVRSILALHGVGGQGVVRSPSSPSRASGFLSVPEFDLGSWGREQLKKLAAMAPGSTLKDIVNGQVRREFRFLLPPRIYNFREISCKNQACVSHPSNGQREVTTHFLRVPAAEQEQQQGCDGPGRDRMFACRYCETPHDFGEIWDFKSFGP